MTANYETKHKKHQVSLPRWQVTLYRYPIHEYSVFLTILYIGYEFIVFGSFKINY